MAISTSFSVSEYVAEEISLWKRLDFDSVLSAVNLIHKKYNDGKKVITCGNGGSANTASHYITDWNKATTLATGKKFKGISLVDNIGLLTAYANDVGYESIFSGQLASILDVGDLVIAVSGSGNSANVIKACEYAQDNGADTLAIVGYDGGNLMNIAKHVVWIPSFDMQLCEDLQLVFGHMVMKSLCGGKVIIDNT